MTSISTASVPAYLAVEKDEAASVKRYAESTPTDEAAVTALEDDASSISSPEDLLNNYQALKVVLGAYGLSSLMDQKAVVTDLLTQDPTSSTSLAATAGNSSWKTFAEDFADWSSSPLSSSTGIASLASSYMTAQFEDSQNDSTPGLGNALYFTRTMTSDMTLSDVMSDSKLLNVVETVSGYDPTQFGALDYDQQVALLQPHFESSDFSSSDTIKRYAEQYLAMLQINPQPTTTPASMLSLYGASSTGDGILSLFGVSSDDTSSTSLFSALF